MGGMQEGREEVDAINYLRNRIVCVREEACRPDDVAGQSWYFKTLLLNENAFADGGHHPWNPELEIMNP